MNIHVLTIISLIQQLNISLSCNTGLCGVGCRFYINAHSCAGNYQFNPAAVYATLAYAVLVVCFR